MLGAGGWGKGVANRMLLGTMWLLGEAVSVAV